MLGMRRHLLDDQIWVASVIAAVFHNLGQTLAAILVYQTPAVAFYLPVRLLSGVITGAFSGLTVQDAAKRIGRR